MLTNLDKVLEEMPAVSSAALKLLEIINNPRTSREDVMKLVSVDEVLLASVFKYANSAAFGGYKRYESLKEIIEALGFNNIREIAVMVAARSVIKNNDLWLYSVFLGISAQKLAKQLDKDIKYTEEIYMASLLSSYGKLIINHFYPDEYSKIQKEEDFRKQLQIEERIFGINHLQLSANVLYAWGLPGSVISIIRNDQLTNPDPVIAQQNEIMDLARRLTYMEESDEYEIEDLLYDPEIRPGLIEHGIDQLKISPQFLEECFRDANEFTSF